MALKITLSNKTMLKMGGQTGQVGSYTLWNQLRSRNTSVSKPEAELKMWDKVRAALYLYPLHLPFTISSSQRMYILYFPFLPFHLFFLKPDLICAIYKNHYWKMHMCHFLIQTSHDWRIFLFHVVSGQCSKLLNQSQVSAIILENCKAKSPVAEMLMTCKLFVICLSY